MPKKKIYYTTLNEAKVAIKMLTPVPTNEKEYFKIRKQDKKLPTHPDREYRSEWTNWYDFMGKIKPTFYASFEEAKSAVQQLSPVPKTQIEYQKNKIQDSKLTSVPMKIYEDSWVDWYDFLGKEKRIFYSTIEEAKIAVQRLTPVPKTMDEYIQLCNLDIRLPACPDKLYKKQWVSSYDFLGTTTRNDRLYQTLKEAKSAVKNLKSVPQTMRDYYRVYKCDSRLPHHPNESYKDDWVSWPDFLDKKLYNYKELVAICDKHKIKKVSTLAKFAKKDARISIAINLDKIEGFYDFASMVGAKYECPIKAIQLIQCLAPTLSTISEYQELSKWYRSLPEDPVTAYGFNMFEDFLSFNEKLLFTKEEAKEFCQTHKITTPGEYKEFALKTPSLPINMKEIVGVTRLSQIRYTESPFSVFDSNNHDDWVNIATEYCSKGKNSVGRQTLIKAFFTQYKGILHSNIERQCLISTELINPIEWFNSLPISNRKEASLNHLKKFFDFVLEKRCSDVDEETGEVVLLEGYRMPVRFTNLPIEYLGNSLSETNKEALPFKFIQKCRNFIIPEQITTLGDMYHSIVEKTDLFTNFTEWFDVEESLIDKKDHNCIWRKHPQLKQLQMWSPVKLVASLLQLYMPLRGSQVVWLDSGEADKYKLTQNAKGEFVWEENTSLTDFRIPVKRHQGFFKPEKFGDENSLVHAHINTNKTARNSYQGYNVPWIDERVIPFLIQLRNWQEKYNFLSKPTLWKDADIYKSTAKSELYKYGYKGTNCFLFRNPCSGDGQSPIKQHMLASTLSCVLYQIQDDDLKLTKIKDKEKSVTSTNIFSYFSLHTMRVSLITAYIRDAKIAPEIVQKIVGHSSIVMTIYYTKVRMEEIKDELKYAEERIVKNQTQRVEQLIRQRKLDQLASELISLDGKVKASVLSKNRAANAIMDYGICPNGRTKCDQGSLSIEAKSNKVLPVEAGYLGRENCPRCRFFLTGPAFLGGLQLLVNEISLECKSSSFRISDFGEEIDQLEKEKYLLKKSGKSFDKEHKLEIANSNYQQEVTYLDNLTVDMISAIRLSFNALELLNSKKPDGSGIQLITSQNEDELKLQLNETSEYLHLDTICQSAVYYQSSRPEKANINRSQLIDMFATKNGLMPGMFALTPEKQIEVGNEVTNMLLARLGSYEKLSDAMDKQSLITLEDLGIEKPTETKKELKLLLAGNNLKLTHSNDSKKGAKKDEL